MKSNLSILKIEYIVTWENCDRGQYSSRNQSDVTKWGILRQFESGRVLVNTKRFLGYDKNKDKELIINEKEAELVRRVFTEYLEGKSCNAIGKGLMNDKIKTVTGNIKWWDSTISGMLENDRVTEYINRIA